MQVQFDDIASSEPLLWQVSQEELVDDARTRDAHRALLFACGMRGHHRAAAHALRTHRDLWAVVEAANHLAFGTVLELIRRQVETRLDERMIKHAVLFATGHKREASHIGEHRPIPILPIEPQQRAFL